MHRHFSRLEYVNFIVWVRSVNKINHLLITKGPTGHLQCYYKNIKVQ